MVRKIAAFALLVVLGSAAVVGAGPTPGRAEVMVDLNLVFAPGAPPAAPVEVIGVAPGPGRVWIGGHYAWRAGRWVWIHGYWSRVPVGYAVWMPGHWDRRDRGWVWVEGRWR
ncbi:MAG: C-type lectin domain-containing protein [bacterium]